MTQQILTPSSTAPGVYNGSIVIDNGIDVLRVNDNPPGLGSIPDESIVIKAWSEPPGRSFCVSASSEDGVIELDNDRGIDVIAADDSIRLFTSDLLDGEHFVKKFKCLLGKAEFEEPLDDDRVDATWSEPPGLGLIPSKPRLSTSTVLDFDDDDGTFKIPSEPPDGLGSHLPSSAGDLSERDH